LTAAIACVATVCFGVFPAFRLVRRDIIPMMKSAAAARTGTARLRPATILMAVQVAISIPLVAGAAIFLQTVHNLGRVDLGFNPDRLLSFRLNPSLSGYQRAQVEQIYDRILDRLRATPGVSSATLVSEALLSGFSSSTTLTLDDGNTRNIYFNRIGPDYFSTMGIQLIAGRSIDARDRTETPRVIVINEAAAAALFGNEPPLGRRLKIFNADTEVVGVVADAKIQGFEREPGLVAYVPYGLNTRNGLSLVIKGDAGDAAAIASARRVVKALDPDLPLRRVRTLDSVVDDALAMRRFQVRLLMAFGAAGLLLACLGVYGVLSAMVDGRRSELAIRLALGAHPSRVGRLILVQGLTPVVFGLAIGLAAGVASARLVASLLFGVTPAQPAVLVTVILVVLAVAVVACLEPAARAARTSFVSTFR